MERVLGASFCKDIKLKESADATKHHRISPSVIPSDIWDLKYIEILDIQYYSGMAVDVVCVTMDPNLFERR